MSSTSGDKDEPDRDDFVPPRSKTKKAPASKKQPLKAARVSQSGGAKSSRGDAAQQQQQVRVCRGLLAWEADSFLHGSRSPEGWDAKKMNMGAF